jgi:serine/threonine protein kinase/formylglycine-generating enzyme required for sulfatase activity
VPSNAQRIQDVFLAASAIDGPAVRARLLDDACGGNAGLKARVEALLRAHDRPDSLLDHPAVAPHDPDEGATRTYGHEGAMPSDDEAALGFLSPPTRPDSLGRIGHYEVLQVLGQGGFGIVFRAFDDVLHRVVAVKVLSPQMATTSPARKRFIREARSSAQVRHENVVQVYEVAEQPLPYIVMEFIPGETLQQRLDRIGPVDVLEVVRIGRQIAEGLAAAHATDLIHRDIKPGNILLEGGAGRVKITDFGLARAADDASISQSGIIAGTPMYMAPEQALGAKLDQRADLFSLGSVLYQMAAGRAPFRANSTVAVLKRVAEDTPRDIREVVPEVPQWLCDIISKLHAKDPADRFQSAREVADVLADCEAQLKANAKLKDFSRIPKSKRPAARRAGRWKWVAAAVLLLPVIALAVTEGTGVSHLYRGRASADPADPIGDPAPAAAAKTDPPVPVGRQDPPSLAVAPFDAAQARAHQEAWAGHLGVPVEYTNSVGMTLRLIPPGEFTMGCTPEQAARLAQSHPDLAKLQQSIRDARSRPARAPRAFYAGVHEVTYAQFREFVRATGTKTRAEASGKGGTAFDSVTKKSVARPEYVWSNRNKTPTDDHPVLFVCAVDAEAFCRWLSQREGRTYALPTEEQWEYFCRAGTTSAWWSGDDPARATACDWINTGSSSPVGRKAANPFGLFDVHGNVREIARRGPGVTIACGGGSRVPLMSCLSASRGGTFDDSVAVGNDNYGFRVITTVEPRSPEAKAPPPAVAPFTDADVKRVAALPAAEQVEEVRKELVRRNPGFDGTVEHKIEDGVVTELRIVTDKVTDISPIRIFNALRVLECSGTAFRPEKAALADLTPLTGMSMAGLTQLDLSGTKVGDAALVHFKGCKKLTSLNLNGTPMTDAGLAHFKDCKDLQVLNLGWTRVGDAGLAHFKDCKNLKGLALNWAAEVTDAGLAHFKGCSDLTTLLVDHTKVTELSLLKGMPLKELSCDFRPERDAEILRSIRTLERINGKPAVEFWKDIEKE